MTIQIITNRREMKAHLEGFIFKDVCFIQVILGRIKSVSRDLSLVSLHFLPILNQWLKVLGGFSRESISGSLPSVLFSKEF